MASPQPNNFRAQQRDTSTQIMNQPRKKTYKYNLLLLALTVLFVGLFFVTLYLFIDYMSTPVEKQSRFEKQNEHTILDNTPQFELLWQSSDHIMHNLAIADGHIFTITDEEYYAIPPIPNPHMVLTQIDLETGEHTWKQEDKYFGNILHDDAYIFVQRNNTEVVAYNLQDLEVAWVRDFSPFKNVSNILLSENYLIVHLSQDNTVVLENSSGGLFLDESSSLYSKLLYFNQDTSYFSVSDFSLLAYDHTTSTELWRHESNGFEGEPYFDGDIIYIQTFYGQIQALDTLTGSLLWETKRPASLIDAERVVSNFSVTEQYLFYLTQDAQLRVLNKFTGELVGKVNFSNSLFLLGDDIAEYYFEVAADSNYVALFFADSWQFFVFRFVG